MQLKVKNDTDNFLSREKKVDLGQHSDEGYGFFLVKDSTMIRKIARRGLCVGGGRKKSVLGTSTCLFLKMSLKI